MKNRLIFLTAILLILLPFKVDAAGLCTSKKYGELKSEAYHSKISYELKFDAEHKAYFDVTIFNVSKDIVVIFNDVDYESDNENKISINKMLDGGKTYEFKFYGGYDSACIEEYLSTKTLTLPKYNYYSERNECIEYVKFPLCGKYYDGEIPNDNYFNEKLQEYINSLKPVEPEQEEEEELTWLQEIIKIYTDNLIISIAITAVIVIGVIALIIRKIVRKKNRIKLDLKEFDI